MQKISAITCLLFCCLLSISIFAQRNITGTVINSNNEELVGVRVVLKDYNNIATSTNSKGYFELQLPDNKQEYIVEASLLGYKSQSKKTTLNNTDKLNFYLQEEDVDLDVVVVTGTRTPKLLKNSPIITKVIGEEELAKIDANHIGDLLQSELPGVEFTYSMNQQVSLNMQGFGGNAVLFLIDGERIAGETLENIDYNRLNLDNVQRVEIIKGAASSLYGSNAIGAVVNIICKEAKDDWTLNLNGRVGAHNEQRYGGSSTIKTGKFRNTINVQRSYIDGYKMKNDGAYSSIMGNQTWNFKEQLQFTPNEKLKMLGRAGYYFRERDSQVKTKERYRSFNGGLKGNYVFDKKNNLEISYVFDQYDKSNYLVQSMNDIRNYSNVQHNIRALFAHIFNENNSLIVGGDYMRDNLMSYQFAGNGSHKQYTTDIFTQIAINPLKKFHLIAGLRYDFFSENHLNNFSSSIATMYKTGDFSLRSSYAGGFRAPTLKEMYMEFDMASVFMIYGNTELKPEISQNFSVSCEYSKSYYNFSLIGYYNLVDNKITTVWNQELNGMKYNNIADINIAGLDANASAKFPCGISVRLSYNYTHEQIKKGQPLVSNTRPHSANARIEYGKYWKNYGFNFMLNGRFLSKVTANEYTSSTSYEEIEEVTYPGYTIWKLSLLQKIRKGVNLNLNIDNLFNYIPSYYYSNSPYTTGTTFSAGISLDIDKMFK